MTLSSREEPCWALCLFSAAMMTCVGAEDMMAGPPPDEEDEDDEEEDEQEVESAGCVSGGWRRWLLVVGVLWWVWFLSPPPPPPPLLLLLLPLLSLVQSVLSRWSESPLAPISCLLLPPAGPPWWLTGTSCRPTTVSPPGSLLLFLRPFSEE